MPGKKFFITPNGNCSVFLSSQHSSAPLHSPRVITNTSSTTSGREGVSKHAGRTEPAFPRIPDVGGRSLGGEAFLQRPKQHLERPLERPPRLKPLLNHDVEKNSARRKRAKHAATETAPWELAELEYLQGLKRPSHSQQLCTALLECYCEPSKAPLPRFSASKVSSVAVVPDDASSISTAMPSRPRDKAEPEDIRAVSAPAASAPPVLVPEAAMPVPLSAEGHSRTPLPSPLKRVVLSRVAPLTLPGMISVPPAADFLGGNSRSITPSSILQKFSPAGTVECDFAASIEKPPTPDPEHGKEMAPQKTRWAVLSPFLSFLKRPRKATASEDEIIESFSQPMGVHSSANHPNDMEAPSSTMHAKTLGMVDSLQQWLSVSVGQVPEKSDMLEGFTLPTNQLTNEITGGGDKAEIRALIVLAKKYNLPVQDVREMKREFVEHDKDGTGEISWEEFQGLIRKRGNLPPEEAIPAHLLQGMANRQPTAIIKQHEISTAAGHAGHVGFEEFLRWTIHTAWSEEMLMPNPEERKIRQMARDQGMLLPDVEKVKQIFDEFDTDGSGEIEEEEFRHILYKMLHVRDITDVPIKRLQRYWREVDLDGSGSIGFNEFLIWYKTSFAKDGRVEVTM